MQTHARAARNNRRWSVAVTPRLILSEQLEGVATAMTAVQREPGRWSEGRHKARVRRADNVEDAQIEFGKQSGRVESMHGGRTTQCFLAPRSWFTHTLRT